jgi:hypothetical protein
MKISLPVEGEVVNSVPSPQLLLRLLAVSGLIGRIKELSEPLFIVIAK